MKLWERRNGGRRKGYANGWINTTTDQREDMHTVARQSAVLKALQDEYVRCRTFGHAWDEFAPIDRIPTVFKYALHLRCTRCTTERHDGLNVRGGVEQREYKYPEGYALAEKMTRAQFRVELRMRSRNGQG
jgi:hypothetical protein